MASVDVSVRGAGIFGLCVAWASVKAGAGVEIVDPGGAGAGASGGIVGALAPHVPENWNSKKQFQLESLLMAESFWAEVTEAGGGDPGYLRTGRVQPLADDGAVTLARHRSDGAAALWRGRAIWEVTDDPRGWDIGSGSAGLVFDTLSALIHPRRSCAALAAALRARGVPVLAEPRACGAPIVWATGVAGLEALGAAAGRPVGQAIKGQAALLRLDRAGLSQLFVGGLHVIPHADGTVAVGSTTEREFGAPDGTDHLLDALLTRAVEAVPELAGAEVLERWAGLRPRARTRAPMLGAWPGRPGHYVANGGFKIGFGMAPKVGEVMAALVLEGRSEIPPGFAVGDNL